MRLHAPQKGFTLIELIIYIAILAMALVVIIAAVLGFARIYRSAAAAQSLSRSGAYAMERMVREIRNARSIDQTGSTLGTHPGRLTVLTPATPTTASSTEFSVASSSIRVARDGAVIGALTTPGTTVDSLVFYRIAATTSEAVRIVLTLSKVVGASTITATFYDSAVLRGSYPL